VIVFTLKFYHLIIKSFLYIKVAIKPVVLNQLILIIFDTTLFDTLLSHKFLDITQQLSHNQLT
jgi:hypothetical protein